MSELLCECCPMSVDQALEYVESGRPGRRQSHAAYRLAKEVRRLRAGVEAVRALDVHGVDFDLIDRDDVLAALGATDD